MKLNRNYITPFIALIFLVVATSGILMFLHLFDGYTEVVHEYLGVGFVIVAVFHIIVNLSKAILKRKSFYQRGLQLY